MHDAAVKNAVSARVVTATLEVIGSVVKETVAVALGCRGEGKENCKVVLGYAKETAQIVGKGIKYAITAVGAKPAVKRVMSGNALKSRLVELGLPEKSSGQWFEVSAEQYVKDSTTLLLQPIFLGTASLGLKVFRTVFSWMKSPRVKEYRIKDSTTTHSYVNKDGRTVIVKEKNEHQNINPLKTRFSDSEIFSNEVSDQKSAYLRNRIIKEKTQLLPEDIGVNPDLFHDVKQFRELRGSMEIIGDALRVKVAMIDMPDNTLGALFNVIVSLKKIARVNDVTTLEVEARITNQELKSVMLKRYGKFLSKDSSLDEGWNLFRIPANKID